MNNAAAPIASEHLFEDRKRERTVEIFKSLCYGILSTVAIGSCFYAAGKVEEKQISALEQENAAITQEYRQGLREEAERLESFQRIELVKLLGDPQISRESRWRARNLLLDLDHNGVAPDYPLPVINTR